MWLPMKTVEPLDACKLFLYIFGLLLRIEIYPDRRW